MSGALILTVGGLAAVGTYLITSRSLSRILIGFALLGHAAVLALLAAGGPAGEAPLADRAAPADIANPLPQALGLTAIVISMALTLYLLAGLAARAVRGEGLDLDAPAEGDGDASPEAVLAELEGRAVDGEGEGVE